MRIAFFGSSLVSAYWNGAATYYRGLLKAMAARGHRITFFEPDAFGRQQHRDMADPDWATVRVYPATGEGYRAALREAWEMEPTLLVKASGVGVFDRELEIAIATEVNSSALRIFWDVDAPATLASIEADRTSHMRHLLPSFDMVLTYGGGDPVIRAYRRLGARACVPIYNALDRQTHYPVTPEPAFECDLAFLGNRLPDREARVKEFFFKAANLLPGRRFLLGGAGWDDYPLPPNVRWVGHVYTRDHNAFNSTPLSVLNINRASMADYGFSPPTRIFEAAGAGACLISDAWEGLDRFLAPGREVLVAKSGEDVAAFLSGLDTEAARSIGQAARQAVLKDHTYDRRAEQLDALFRVDA